MQFFIDIINLILYSAWDWLNQILIAFGLSWAGLTVGLAVISVILRLFAANLVGASVNMHHTRQEAAKQQKIEKQKARSSRGLGASTPNQLRLKQ